MLINQNSLESPRNLALVTYSKFLIVFLTKLNIIYLLYSTAQKFGLLHQIKHICVLTTFLRTLFLMTQVCLYVLSF